MIEFWVVSSYAILFCLIAYLMWKIDDLKFIVMEKEKSLKSKDVHIKTLLKLSNTLVDTIPNTDKEDYEECKRGMIAINIAHGYKR